METTVTPSNNNNTEYTPSPWKGGTPKEHAKREVDEDVSFIRTTFFLYLKGIGTTRNCP